MSRRKRSFHSFLAPHLQAYLEFKQKLRYSSFGTPYTAQDLDYYLVFYGVSSVKELDEGLIVNWLHSVPRRAPATKNRRLCFVRGFFNYLVRIEMARDNPALRISYLKERAYKPYIYTLKEIQQVLEAAGKLKHKHPNRLLGWTMETLIFLLYACGLRLGEALNLKIQDVDFDENTLSLWKTKFHKERLVPFSPAARQKLQSYLALRKKSYPPAGPRDPFFCHARGKYHKNFIQKCFRRLLVRCGLAKPTGRGAPRLHDLRHAFACHRLYKWYQDGHDILNKLPLLSTYMGHVNIENTSVYLTITRAMIREGDRRFQGAFENVTDKALRRALKNL